MSGIRSASDNPSVFAVDNQLRFIPEPKTSSTFEAVRKTLGILSGPVSGVASLAGSALGGSYTDAAGGYQDLLSLQIQSQKELMVVSMISNVEKSKHETQMSAVRNIRVS